MDISVLNIFYAPPQVEYIMKCTGWSTPTFNTMDWEIKEQYMAQINDTKGTTVVKFLCDWEITGKQNIQFQTSESNKPSTHKAYEDIHTMCPLSAVQLKHHYTTFNVLPLMQEIPPSSLYKNSAHRSLKGENTAMLMYNAIVLHLAIHTKITQMYQP